MKQLQIQRPHKAKLFDYKKAMQLDELEVMLIADEHEELVINGALVRELATVRHQTDKTSYITIIPAANVDGTFSDRRERTTVALTTDIADAVTNSTSKRTWIPSNESSPFQLREPTHSHSRDRSGTTSKTDVVTLQSEHYRPCSDLHGIDDTVVVTRKEQLEGCLVFVEPEVITQALAPRSRHEVIRVGTCGDYSPLTVYESHGAASGLEVELLEAAFPGRIEWVRTTWPELHKGLEDGTYDAAFGGINHTALRARQFQVSDSVLPCGKCALASKASLEKHQFKKFTEIDQPGLTVISNPGGTNELFCRLNFKKANVRIAANNKEPFDDLVAGRADVMITDTIEAFHRANTMPELVALFTDTPLTSGHTVALARKNCPVGTSFIKNFNSFLHASASKPIFKSLTRTWLGNVMSRVAKL